MKKILKSFALIVALGLSASASAQFAAGVLVGTADFQSTDIISSARTSNSYTTARVAGMGGAFTSLGGDLASISINPAGLGMFRSSIFGFSPSLISTTRYNSGQSNTAPIRFSMNNLGMATNVYEGAGDIVSVSLGFSYNKMADLNYESRIANSGRYSIADMFAAQMNGIPQSWLGSSANPFDNYDLYINEWGGVLAYQTLLIDPAVLDDPANDRYHVTALDPNAGVYRYMSLDSRGSIGEYSFAAGMNIRNTLYLGATVVIEDIYNERDYIYDEDYDNGENSNDPAYLASMTYNPHVKEAGTGVGLRLGAILRPVGGLRIGVAFHTPLIVALQKEYYAVMGTRFQGERNYAYKSTLRNIYTYNYTTPAKLSVGASYTFGNVAALSFDYDRVWYGNARMKDDSRSVNDYMNANIRQQYKAANNLRAGVEVKAMDWMALRAGYAYYGSPSAVGSNVFDSPLALESRDLTFGVGFKIGRTSIDAAFINKLSKLSSYDLFYWGDGDDATAIAGELVTNNKERKNIFTLSITMPF